MFLIGPKAANSFVIAPMKGLTVSLGVKLIVEFVFVLDFTDCVPGSTVQSVEREVRLNHEAGRLLMNSVLYFSPVVRHWGSIMTIEFQSDPQSDLS